MEPAFWHERWQLNQIAFHEGAVNDLLKSHFHRLGLAPGSRIFVPLCGKAVDLNWLLAQGHRLVGIELSQPAVKEVFDRLGLKPEVSKSGTLAHYGAKNIEIYVGDFFDLSAETLGQVDAVYDRAALVALPVEMRRLYTRHLMALTQAASQLLITLEYDQSQMAGPPFSVSGDEISAHYGDHYRPDLISSKAIDGPLAARCSGTENAWLLQAS